MIFLDDYLKDDVRLLKFMHNTPKENGVQAHLLSLDTCPAQGNPPNLATLASGFALSKYENSTEVYGDINKREPLCGSSSALIVLGDQYLDVSSSNCFALCAVAHQPHFGAPGYSNPSCTALSNSEVAEHLFLHRPLGVNHIYSLFICQHRKTHEHV